MSKKTIAKLSVFVIFTNSVLALAGCSRPAAGGKPENESSGYGAPTALGKFQNPAIKESSGVAASLCQPGVYWTHNDSADGPYIFAIESTGRSLGTWRVADARNVDWEDMATAKDTDGKCVLFIGEIGNNEKERTEAAIYKVPEPVVDRTVQNEAVADTAPPEVLRFRYPDKVQNAETLLANPTTGFLYVLTKRFDGPASIYRLAPNFGLPEVAVAEKIGEIAVPSVPNGLLTGGSISPDGKRVIICDYTNGYELTLPTGAEFDEIWKQKPAVIDLGDRKQGEAVTYTADGRAVVATSEKKGSILYEVVRNK